MGALEKLCIPCYSGSKNSRRKLKSFYSIQNKFEKVLSVENFFRISREVQFYKFLFLDEFKKKILKVCPTPYKRKIDDSSIFETKFAYLLEDNKSESNKINKKIIDYFTNSKN